MPPPLILMPWNDPCISVDYFPDSCPIHHATFIAQLHSVTIFCLIQPSPLCSLYVCPFLYLTHYITPSLLSPCSPALLCLFPIPLPSPSICFLSSLLPFLPAQSPLSLSSAHSHCSPLLPLSSFSPRFSWASVATQFPCEISVRCRVV